ncbi:MAG: hypothetical protein KDK90_02660 [Leptospiraceae bacterium]|nr:hypothetical protein [Leptospiraceae bacterium]
MVQLILDRFILDKTYNGSIFTKRVELDEVRVSNKVLLDVLKDFLP